MTITHSSAFVALATAALTVATGANAASLPPPAPALAFVFHVSPPALDDASVAAADVALRAPEEIGEPLAALRRHPGAKVSFAIAPSYLDALHRAAAGDSALSQLASGDANPGGDTRMRAVLALLARHRPLDPALAHAPAGARYLTLSVAAQNLLAGERSAPFSRRDVADFAAVAAQIEIAASGSGPLPGGNVSAKDALGALARADASVAAELDRDVRAGKVELIAVPDSEPVLPLLVDAGGLSRTDRRTVDAGTQADALRLVSDGVRGVADFARTGAAGLYSPFGAYDDATATLIKRAGAAYALFSDRVVLGAGGHGSESGIDASRAAALRAYALTVDKNVVLPVLFWSESASSDIEAATGSSGAPAQRLLDLARDAADRAQGATPSIFLVRVAAEGAWSRRPDARVAMNELVGTIASGRIGSPTTPGAYLRAHSPTDAAYGYPPRTESGSFALWMGSKDQASLWNAFAAARKSAGGDAALENPRLRLLIFAAESGAWYANVATPSGAAHVARTLDAFRALIAEIYRTAGQTPPAAIAPVAPPTPAPTAP